jgi:anti-sigma regulatory factor (Ser/Thr protein kinase)
VTTTAARQAWPAAASAVPEARRMVRETLRGAGRCEVVESAELIVSELVSNVVLHVGGDLELAVDVRADEVVIEVSDSSPLSPHLRMFSRTSSTGRGMRLVHSLSAEHGVRPRHADDRPGKTIWVRLTTASSARGDDEIAASFADVDWLAELADVELDERTPAVRDLRPVA